MAVPLISRGDIGDIFSKKRDYPVNKTRYETPLDPYLPNFMNKKPIHSPAFQVEVVKVCPEKLTRESDAKKETKKKAGSSSALVNRGQFGFVPVPGIAASIRKKQAAYAPMFVSKESISRFFLKKAFAYFPLLKPMVSQFFSSPSRASLGGASIKHSVPQGIRPQLMGLAAVDELKTTGSAEQERKIAREKEEKMAKEQAGKQAKNIWKFSQLLKVTSDTLKALASISPEIGLAQLGVSAAYSIATGGIAVKEVEAGKKYEGWRAPFSYGKRFMASGTGAALSVSANITLNAIVGIVAAPVGIVASLLGIGKATYDISDKKAEIKIGKEVLKQVTKEDAQKMDDYLKAFSAYTEASNKTKVLIAELSKCGDANRAEELRTQISKSDEACKALYARQSFLKVQATGKSSLVADVIQTMKEDILGNRLGIAARTFFIGSSTTAIVGFAVTGGAITLGFTAIPVVGQVALGLMVVGAAIFIASAVIRVNAQQKREALEDQLKDANISLKAKPQELRDHFARTSSAVFGVNEA